MEFLGDPNRCELMRLLFILPGPVPPSADASLDKYKYLSEIAEGEVLLPVWWASENSVPEFLRGTFPVFHCQQFSYSLFLSYRYHRSLRGFANFIFYIHRGLQLHRAKKIDFIITYGSNLTGLAGVVLKWITGAKLIVEIPGVPENAFQYDAPHPGKYIAAKRFFADLSLLAVGKAADCLKLLYPQQLQHYPRLQEKGHAVFHDFVPVRTIRPGRDQERYILLAGEPWYTKGVDVLIRAFKLIAGKFPAYKLKLLGYYPDRGELNDLARGSPQIEFLAACPYDRALSIIGSCSVFVLASRSEGMGRVLLEAMAARKPIIASAVGGIPHYIRDNDNGLLFQSENVEELAAKLTALLENEELQSRLATRAYERVLSECDEGAYVRSFRCMLRSLQNGSAAS